MSGTRIDLNRPVRSKWPWWRRVIREFVWSYDLDDGTGDGSPSLTKWMAWLGGHAAIASMLFGIEVTANHIWLYIVATSAAFGRSMFKMMLSRTSFGLQGTTTSTTTRSVSEQTVHTIQERRNPDEGYEETK